MPVDVSKIEQLAPDQASLGAAAKLKKASLWSLLACESSLVWGECQGSGSSPYRVICSEADLGYKCTCPSRKFPCKHVLALMWMRAEGALSFKTEPPPAWVGDWLARRRPGATSPRTAGRDPDAKASVAQATSTEAIPADPMTAARAAAQRERNKAEREAAISVGLEQLDIWIADALQRGLAAFLPIVGAECRKIVPRLVDAKVPGLASRVERLPADVLSVPESMRTDALIERLATLYLISSAYRNQERLPSPVRADVRQLVGWPVTRDALLADAETLRVKDRWMVVSTTMEIQPDKLRRLETWISRLGDGAAPRFAVLTDFVPISLGSAASTYRIGETFEAELAYFPSPARLRAIVVAQNGTATAGERWPRPADDMAIAIERLNDCVAARPWASEIPFAARDARILESDASLWLTDHEGTSSLPLRADPDDLALPLVGLDGIDVFGRWDGHYLSLGLAETPLGRWTAS
jgi:SWIM zinc finger